MSWQDSVVRISEDVDTRRINPDDRTNSTSGKCALIKIHSPRRGNVTKMQDVHNKSSATEQCEESTSRVNKMHTNMCICTHTHTQDQKKTNNYNTREKQHRS